MRCRSREGVPSSLEDWLMRYGDNRGDVSPGIRKILQEISNHLKPHEKIP